MNTDPQVLWEILQWNILFFKFHNTSDSKIIRKRGWCKTTEPINVLNDSKCSCKIILFFFQIIFKYHTSWCRIFLVILLNGSWESKKEKNDMFYFFLCFLSYRCADGYKGQRCENKAVFNRGSMYRPKFCNVVGFLSSFYC